MQTPVNPLKQALAQGRPQIGLWMAMANPITAEICAGAGFDWLLIDGEHSPQTLPLVLAQLQAIAAYPGCHAIVRVPSSDPVTIKTYLDLGAQSLLVPMVDTAEQAATIVDAARYPPQGSRGIGGARAARWGRYPRYIHEANDQIGLIVQIETMRALDNIEAIAAVDGIDALFVGPADLSASMGHVGQPAHPEVQQATLDAFRRIRAAGRAAGILTRDEEFARRAIEHGALIVGVGVDTLVLAAQTSALAARFVQGD
ncbi:HpcH/HpaI aldolase family protein [Sphingomonas sp.]|uniref:HpcH/HpaI aldolase family protein n=1 Tax=Sphingomonas sp. TaxID=28214 RepID=UPI002FCBDCF5